jgi:hypothetical protein
VTAQRAEDDGDRDRELRLRAKLSRSAVFRYRWILVGAAGIVGFVLGFIGLSDYYAHKPYQGFGTLIYYDLKLLAFGGAPTPPPKLGWELLVARFLLPLVVLYGALAGLIALFRDRYEQARLPFLRGHVLVAGLGDKGLAFVQAMRAQKQRVVVIESDPANANVATARDAGATVVLGDATDEGLLAVAGVRRARYLLATADDATNAEVALQAERLTRIRRHGPLLECLAHVVDPDLCLLLKLQALATDHGGGFRVDFFNFYEQAARLACDRTLTPDCRVVIIGDSPLVEQIARRVAIADSLASRPVPREITIVHPDAERRVQAIRARHPEIPSMRALALELDAPLLRGSRVLPSTEGAALVYVCATEDAVGVEIALSLKGRARETGSRLVVCAGRSDGLATVLTGGRTSPLGTITVLALARDTCTSDLVSQGIYELLGRAVHDDYVRRRGSEPSSNQTDPALAPWDELLPAYKDSDRAQAQHIGVKLETIGCDLVPVDSVDLAAFEFTDSEVELLAQMEHDRWVDERRGAGWRSGEARDPVAMTTPYLVPWDELTEEIRDRDRETVHRIPGLVAQAGFRVQRLDAAQE